MVRAIETLVSSVRRNSFKAINFFVIINTLVLALIYHLNPRGTQFLIDEPDPHHVKWHDLGLNHMLYIGDSLTRYQFLALVYKAMAIGVRTPDFLVSEYQFDSWPAFFRNSTATLNNSFCSCDCFRLPVSEGENINSPFMTIRENRFCDIATDVGGRIWMSYFQLFGEKLSLHGTVLPNETRLATIDEVQRPDRWQYVTVGEFLRDYVVNLQPPPTHIVLAAGAWPHERIALELPDTLRAAHSVAPFVYWKETSPFLTDNLTAHGPFSRPRKIDNIAKTLCGTGLCTYISFPSFIPRDLLDEAGLPHYLDHLHFRSGKLYDFWNAEVLKVMRNFSDPMRQQF